MDEQSKIMRFLNDFLNEVEKPSRYIGGELNQILKNPEDVKLRIGLLFPDVYEIGMSNLGLLIIYYVLNSIHDVWAERAFLPWIDMINLMRTKNIELFTHESKTPLRNLDMIGISLQYELSYTNVLWALNLSKIPIIAEERRENDPIIVAGGPCTVNPEVIAPVFDAIVIGDGEEVAVEIAYRLIETKNLPRQEKLRSLSKIKGVYVPIFYVDSTPPFPSDKDIPEKISRRTIPDLNKSVLPPNRIIPHAQIVHDRIVVEAMRGCTRGCRFCQAGMIYRPVREKFSETMLKESFSALLCTGYEELALLSLSTADHSNIEAILSKLKELLKDSCTSISMPSTRLDAFALAMANVMSNVRRAGLTFAPEAGTQRLRNVINKNISEEDYVKTLETARKSGWNRIKLYFMIGLPTETDKDLSGIIEMANIARKIGFKKINISISNFIPKPHTPFQFSEQKPVSYIKHAQRILTQARKFANISFHDPEMSLIEGLISRGDRSVFKTLINAFKNGAIFDDWDNMFNLDHWQKAIESSKIDPNEYLRPRRFDESLPWDHIDTGIRKQFLIEEYQKALSGLPTQDCRWSSCSNCGVCNKYLKNLLEDR
ncbi:TIGR03960 family B12-binding radical SAM protein [Pseudothermotoga elfii]|uniref:TIGR03960 family B12-binding radical SAM protein n=1 Tax=Pseudothermotoga elfii TaxID=38322 RepID=UPI0003F60CDF|nr:TIGR03960 family B12-binding radical SAM protein [Pseudothermotoga elfii]